MDSSALETIKLTDFVDEFGNGMLDNIKQSVPPVFTGEYNPVWHAILNQLSRKPFVEQEQRIQAATKLLVEEHERAVVINGEMGTGKTMMGICTAELLRHEGYKRCLVICPPHLVYKWRREIQNTVPEARVWILNGPDTLAKLMKVRDALGLESSQKPEYFIMGRVRMRMGFNWKPAFATRISRNEGALSKVCICPNCGYDIHDEDNSLLNPAHFPNDRKKQCKRCKTALWQLVSPDYVKLDQKSIVKKALLKLPTIGKVRATNLLEQFGEKLLGNMLEDNVYEFINLLDENGDFVFSDRQAQRFERSMAKMEFSFGTGGYQPTEFIKRYLPNGYFGSLIVDEGHEYKNAGSAQGQAMGVLSMKSQKVILLTGTLMGGYADDLFYLLMRLLPQKMIEDGFVYNERGSLSASAMSFMRQYGVLKDVYKTTDSTDHRTAKGSKTTVSSKKGPGFSPVGIARYVLPFTVFLKLSDLGDNVLPEYSEELIEVDMTDDMNQAYSKMSDSLLGEMRTALKKGDRSLIGVVLNTLLAWPDCCFRDEFVKHPHTKQIINQCYALFDGETPTPKEAELIALCKREKALNRRVLVYTTYTGKRDTASRLKTLLSTQGFKVAVLRSSVKTDQREDWILDQVDRGIDVLICNPELVKTGLDLLEFPTICFMQSGYNVYTVQQAARRSWRIGQKDEVKVLFLGYRQSAQVQCYELMAKKIQISMSTSGDIPESGLDVLNSDADSIEMELAKKLVI